MTIETIFALSSGVLPAGVAVYRLSGPGAFAAAQELTGAALPAPRVMALRRVRDPRTQALIDSALVVVFPAPRSFTGEDVAELHIHGSRAVAAQLSDALIALGCVPAEAGAFTRRAFLNGKMDLTQVEGLGDLLAAETRAQHKLAMGLAGGAVSEKASQLEETLLGIRANLEALIDFSDEELDGDPFVAARTALDEALAAMARYGADAQAAERVRSGIKVVIAGPPNVGKSSLINMLAQRDVAIVSGEAGTTRDAIEVQLDLAGYPVSLVDTAGLRETTSAVEAEGIRRARRHLEAADIIIELRAHDVDLPLDLGLVVARPPDLVVMNKADMAAASGKMAVGIVEISLKTGAGVDRFLTALSALVVDRFAIAEDSIAANARHARHLNTCATAMAAARQELGRADADIVLAADHLRGAAHALAQIIGRADIEDMLGAIFGRFCIGK